MRIEITYYADDGEEFDNEEECREYERDVRERLESVIFFNQFQELMSEPTIYEIEEKAYYLTVLDPKMAENLFDWLDDQISFNWGAGEPIVGHFYSCEENEWVDMTKMVEETTEKLEKLKKWMK